MLAIKASGARIIFTAVPGHLSLTLYSEAIKYNLTAVYGYQWVGNNDAQISFDVFQIEDPQTNFAGLAHHITSHRITSHHITSHHLPSHHITQA